MTLILVWCILLVLVGIIALLAGFLIYDALWCWRRRQEYRRWK